MIQDMLLPLKAVFFMLLHAVEVFVIELDI